MNIGRTKTTAMNIVILHLFCQFENTLANRLVSQLANADM